jgi:uracil-DNA glycosylase
MTAIIPAGWQPILQKETDESYFQLLLSFLEKERAQYTIFPPEAEVFTALHMTPYDQVRVVILGQDPYHDNNQAHGLAFSVRPGIKPPPSLMNIFRECKNDVGFQISNNGYLAPWAEQGVLLLNTVLTVRAHQANSHRAKGWETFTDRIIQAVSAKAQPVIFVLWGNPAQKKQVLIDTSNNHILTAPHPSPLSASRGFFGSRPFSKINTLLRSSGQPEIHWQLPNL